MSKGIAHRPLSDMESNGVYFEKELFLVGDESLFCNYSGLPSVSSYEDDKTVKVVTQQVSSDQ